MNVPNYDEFGGWSLVLRPDPVLFKLRSLVTKKRGYFFKLYLGIIKMKNSIKTRLAVLTGLVVASVGSAFAAVPTEVSTALTDAKDDASTVAGLFLIAVIAIAAFKLMQRGAN